MEELSLGYRPPVITITADLTGDRLREVEFEWPVIDEAYIHRFLGAIGGGYEGRTEEV
jgi:hypothetical protein